MSLSQQGLFQMDYRIYKKAKRKVRERKRFYSNLMSWLVFSLFLILLNLFTSDYFWAIFPILGWGIGVAFHALRVFGMDYGEEWEERQMRKEIERLKRRRYMDDDDDDVDGEELRLKDLKHLGKDWDESELV